MLKPTRRAIAVATLFAGIGAGPAMAEPAEPAPYFVEPATGQPTDPPCQGEYRSDPPQEGADRGHFIADRAQTSDYGVGDEVTNNQSGDGGSYC